MPRQNALERHLQKDASGLVQPVEVMTIIPTARQEKESRAKIDNGESKLAEERQALDKIDTQIADGRAVGRFYTALQ